MSDPRPVTGSILRDLVVCERRVHHDLHTDPALRDPVGGFVEMLWAGGLAHEAEVLASLPGAVVDLRDAPPIDRAGATLAAIAGGADWILGAELVEGDRLGRPDVLRRDAAGWVAGDVKSGAVIAPNGRPRLEYGVQVAHYAGILGSLGLAPPDRAVVIGRDGAAVDLDLAAPWSGDGGRLIDITGHLISRARAIRDGDHAAEGALSATCKLCCWRSRCRGELQEADDPTLVAGLGRAVRGALRPAVTTVADLAELRPEDHDRGRGRSAFPGVGLERLSRFRDRAALLLDPAAGPYARRPLGLRRVARELHFDIEADPGRDGLVYLHGISERTFGPDGERERFVHFFADGEDGERDAFAAAFAFLTEDPDARIYYYSKYERSAYRALQRRHPDVCSVEDVERLFDPRRAIDLLFDVVAPWTEWPTNDLSIKTLARHVGFRWRDAEASGANSIAWYDEYVRTGDPAVRERILVYNHDDCLATGALLDALIGLPVRQGVGSPASP